MDENLPLIFLLVALVIIILIIFAVHRKRRQNQLRASMYRQWRDYPDHEGSVDGLEIEGERTAVSGHLGASVDAIGVDRMLDDVELSEVRIIKNTPEQKPAARSRYADLVVLYVMARPGKSFVGYELLQALSAAGLQYGEMNIFHQYVPEEDTSNKRKTLFSLASATEPGTFDLSEMGGLQCPGLCLFMDTKNIENSQAAFEQMLGVVKQLAEDLDGIAQDQRRQPLTEQGISVYRARVRNSNASNIDSHTAAVV